MPEIVCHHKVLKRCKVGNQFWYQCECGQKFQAREWDGRVEVEPAAEEPRP